MVPRNINIWSYLLWPPVIVSVYRVGAASQGVNNARLLVTHKNISRNGKYFLVSC